MFSFGAFFGKKSRFFSFMDVQAVLCIQDTDSIRILLRRINLNLVFIIDLYVLVIMIGSQILMTVRSFTLASVMVNLDWVFVQERLSSTMPQVFVMIQILFQDGNPFSNQIFLKKKLAQLYIVYFQRKFLERQRKGRTARLLRLRLLISYHQHN